MLKKKHTEPPGKSFDRTRRPSSRKAKRGEGRAWRAVAATFTTGDCRSSRHFLSPIKKKRGEKNELEEHTAEKNNARKSPPPADLFSVEFPVKKKQHKTKHETKNTCRRVFEEVWTPVVKNFSSLPKLRLCFYAARDCARPIVVRFTASQCVFIELNWLDSFNPQLRSRWVSLCFTGIHCPVFSLEFLRFVGVAFH